MLSFERQLTLRTFDITPDGKQIVFDRLRDNGPIANPVRAGTVAFLPVLAPTADTALGTAIGRGSRGASLEQLAEVVSGSAASPT